MKPHFLLLALLALCACRSQRNVTTDTRQTIETVTKLVPRDTLLPVPKDSVHLRLPLPVPVPDVPPVTLRHGRAVQTVSVRQGVVHAACVCDTAIIKATLWDTWTQTNKDTVTTIREVVLKYRTPAWAWWMLAAISGYIALRLLLSTLKPV